MGGRRRCTLERLSGRYGTSVVACLWSTVLHQSTYLWAKTFRQDRPRASLVDGQGRVSRSGRDAPSEHSGSHGRWSPCSGAPGTLWAPCAGYRWRRASHGALSRQASRGWLWMKSSEDARHVWHSALSCPMVEPRRRACRLQGRSLVGRAYRRDGLPGVTFPPTTLVGLRARPPLRRDAHIQQTHVPARQSSLATQGLNQHERVVALRRLLGGPASRTFSLRRPSGHPQKQQAEYLLPPGAPVSPTCCLEQGPCG
jgi:hypothetical protein